MDASGSLGEALTNSLYRQVTGLDSRVVTRELGDLVSRGFVEQAGSRRWASYRLAPGQMEDEDRLPQTGLRRDRGPEILTCFLSIGSDLAQRSLAAWGSVTRQLGND